MSEIVQHTDNKGIILVRAPTAETGFPVISGSYALLIRLRDRFRDDIGALGTLEFPAGSYLYLGSANGPGGLRARLRRHLRREKKLHWHVDRLTLQGDIAAVVAVPGGSECDLVVRALDNPGVAVPHPGFGSSDCRRCEAHLLSIPGGGGEVLAALA